MAEATATKTTKVAASKVPAQKSAAKPTKAYKPVDLDKLTWYADPTTDKGQWALTVMTVGSYLTSMGVFQSGNFESSRIITTEAQRTILKITPTSKKSKMMRHVARCGPTPTVIMTVKGGLLSPLDGLQRSDVHTQVAQGLLMRKHDANAVLPAAMADATKKLQELGHEVTDLDTFLDAPMKVEIWKNLSVQEEDVKFGTWNLDQNPISTKHMTEILHSDLRGRITAMGIITQTQKEKATPVLDGEGKPVAKPRRKKDEVIPPTEIVRDLASVQVNTFAYLTASRVADKSSMLEERAHGRIHDMWEKIGNEIVTKDLQRFYHELLPALHAKYDGSDSPAGKQIKTESETFTVPVLAALGYARQEGVAEEKIQQWLDEVIELLASEKADPLGLWQGANSWSDVREAKDLKGSAGQKDRKLTFYGWRNAIMKGLPFDWNVGLRDAANA